MIRLFQFLRLKFRMKINPNTQHAPKKENDFQTETEFERWKKEWEARNVEILNK